jgi:TRAP-type mannitol/chloroaromatic compound transport system permease small subunit
MKFFKQLIEIIDRLNEGVGKLVSYLAIVMMISVVYEVVARYIFNSPTIWSMETNQHILLGYTALAGGYALLHGSHVSVDIVYERFSRKKRAFVDICTSLGAFLFISILFWTGWEIAMEAWEYSERSLSLFEMPLFPGKVTIPIGAFLLLLQLFAKLTRDIESLVTMNKTDVQAFSKGGK